MKRRIYAVLGGAVLLTGIGLFAMGFLDFAVYMGQHIPQSDLAGDYLGGLTWAIFLGFTIFFWPIPGRHRPLLLWGWFAKCLVGLGFMLIYEYHYSVDAYWYFDVSRQLDFQPGIELGNGAKLVTSLCWMHNQFFPASYHMMKMTFAMLGLVAIYLFYLAVCQFTDRERPSVFYSMMLFPSIIFWSTILGKDPLILLGVSLYAYGISRWYRTGHFKFLILMGLGICETLAIRVWMAPILLAPLGVFSLRRLGGLFGKALFLAVICTSFYFSFGAFREYFDIESSRDVADRSQLISQSWAHGGSGATLGATFGGPGDMVKFLPLGIFTALFRPLPGEVLNAFGILAGLENLMMLILLFQAFIRTRLLEMTEPWVAWAWILILVWASTYSFASYQNLGTAVRFRLQIQPILLSLLMHLRRRRANDLIENAQLRSQNA